MTTENKEKTTTLAALKQQENYAVGMNDLKGFELMQRQANLLSKSTLVPAQYRAIVEKKKGQNTEFEENPSALSNCVVALNMAQRMGADPLMVMQNLYVVEGRPSWSSQWIIAAINGCGRFSPLRFDIEHPGNKEVTYTAFEWYNRERTAVEKKIRVDDIKCVAWAIEKETGARIDSPAVSIEMAVKEGWYSKNGSKWQTMPEVMLRYRTASFFGKLYAPELLMGLQTVEESQDIIDIHPDGSYSVGQQSFSSDELRRTPARPAEVVEANSNVKSPAEGNGGTLPVAGTVDSETGEITQAETPKQEAITEYTFAHVAGLFKNAQNADDVYAAADLIRYVRDEKQQEELKALYSRHPMLPTD